MFNIDIKVQQLISFKKPNVLLTRSSSFVLLLLLLSFFIGVSWSENANVPLVCSRLRDSRVHEIETARTRKLKRGETGERTGAPFSQISSAFHLRIRIIPTI